MENNMSAKLIFLVGLSGSGKSTWAEEFIKEHDAELLSSDRLRLEFIDLKKIDALKEKYRENPIPKNLKTEEKLNEIMTNIISKKLKSELVSSL